MPSPFPGMNPYLEQESVWRDFRLCFIVAASQLLNRLLSPRHYSVIRAKEFFYESPERGHSDPLQPDAVVHAAPGSSLPVRLPATDKDRESYIEICDAKSREAVAVIQLLSRSTKYAPRRSIESSTWPTGLRPCAGRSTSSKSTCCEGATASPGTRRRGATTAAW